MDKEKWEAREWPERKKEKGAARIEVGDEAGRVSKERLGKKYTYILFNTIYFKLTRKHSPTRLV